MTTETIRKPIWGAKRIADAINRPVRATFNLLESGQIPARKIGGRWCTTLENIDQFFADMSATGKGRQSNGKSRKAARGCDADGL